MEKHILEQDVGNKTVNCIFHIPVPDEANAVGVNWRIAVVRSLKPAPLLNWNSQDENTQIENGEVLEIMEAVRFSSVGLTDTERLLEIDAAYTTRSATLLSELAVKLNFYGLGV